MLDFIKKLFIEEFVTPDVDKLAAEGDVEGLVKALRNSKVRKSAMEHLVSIGQPAVGPLIADLEDPEFYHRAVPLHLLGRIGDTRAVGPMIRASEVPPSDKRRYVRGIAVSALHDMDRSRVEEALIAELKDRNEVVARWAAEVLAQFASARSVEPLIDCLQHGDAGVAGEAAVTLGKLGDARAVEPLIDALRSGHAWIRNSAAAALKQFPDARAAQAIEKRAGTGVQHRGGLGEPYCSDACWEQTAHYAMLEILGARCGVCGEVVSNRAGRRDYAVIPYEGKTLVVCQKCAPTMRAKLQSYDKCCMCHKAL